MRVFSKTIEIFLKKMMYYTKEILENECRVKVGRTRFHIENGWSFPISLVMIEDKSVLGSFCAENLTISLNKCLIAVAKPAVIKDIIRHELVHYFTFIYCSRNNVPWGSISAHGVEFKCVCNDLGFSEHISRANANIIQENDRYEGDIGNEKIISKVQKLLALAKSDNPHEAELATLKANQLMTQHNLDEVLNMGKSDLDIEYFVKLILPCKRSTPTVAAISRILKEFYVSPVLTFAGIEITGTKSNIENAEYIAHYLQTELKAIWQKNKKLNPRLKQKSFMTALKRSYCQKLAEAKNNLSCNEKAGLVKIDQNLIWATSGVYGKLAYRSSTINYCSESERLGKIAGLNLQINRGVSPTAATRLLN